MDTRFSLLTLALALTLLTSALLPGSPAAQSVRQPATVVELYTSQGCNSCPPADSFLSELAAKSNLLALSFNVTYWDYIGWKDTLASKAFDVRQASYRAQMNARYVYTPQMIIGGVKHEVGSDRHAVNKAIGSIDGHARNVPLNWHLQGSDLIIELPARPAEAALWLFYLDKRHDVPVRRGENSGKTLSYYNVVRKIDSLGTWDGSARQLRLDLAEISEQGRDGCALIIQKGGHGEIIAALEVRL